MSPTPAGFLYLGAAVLFIAGLRRLSSPATARSGNQLAAVGMLVAIVVTLLDRRIVGYRAIVAGLVVGGAVGAVLAYRVAMTAMPQLVAAFNGFGGGASALVAIVEFGRADPPVRTLVTVALSTLIGAVTLSGSFAAYAKLQGLMPGRPLTYRGQPAVDTLLVAIMLGLAGWVVTGSGIGVLWALAVTSLVLGVARVLPIGGADMPAVISLLNAFSGVAASTAGFVIESNTLIISGALVGSSGVILTNIMMKGMNRTVGNVLFGAFGSDDSTGPDAGDRPVRAADPEEVAITLAYARSVIVVPGYGLAVAQAQHVLRDLARLLDERGVEVRYAIHPVAGRMPGHMNVLLAEADIPYDRLFDLGDINADFPHTDVALVVGANDVVNPSARDPASPIAGMPVFDVDKASTVVVVKRSLSPGFAGIDNPLFYLDNTMMLFADAKQGLTQVAAAVRAA
ncbi:MAG: NAD(P)(+) transhydrogenase (Re/Si-specific) subunit beta [Acidimicrobiia bacterium]